MSKYDNIKTAYDLAREVRNHGLSCDMEDLCRVQDIISHSTEEELSSLAKNNDTKGIFYMILFKSWNYEDACRFWNQHSNPEHEELEKLRVVSRDQAATIEILTERNTRTKEERDASREAFNDKATLVNQLQKEAEEMQLEIMRLKAQLYDYMSM